MPTFILYRKGTRLDQVKGAHPTELEEKIRKHYGQAESTDPHTSGPGGLTDVFPYIEMKSCECLNESDATPFRDFMEGKKKLISDCDEQLIMVYGFNQNLKVRMGNGYPIYSRLAGSNVWYIKTFNVLYLW